MPLEYSKSNILNVTVMNMFYICYGDWGGAFVVSLFEQNVCVFRMPLWTECMSLNRTYAGLPAFKELGLGKKEDELEIVRMIWHIKDIVRVPRKPRGILTAAITSPISNFLFCESE